MIVLDTRHVSQLRRTDSHDAAKLGARLGDVPRSEARITAVTPYEQLRCVLGLINSAKSAADRVMPFGLLVRLLEHCATRWAGQILPFDHQAAAIAQGFDPKLIRRIGPRDAMIAAMAMVHGAVLLTANTSHFRQVPGLVVGNWLDDDGGTTAPVP